MVNSIITLALIFFVFIMIISWSALQNSKIKPREFSKRIKKVLKDEKLLKRFCNKFNTSPKILRCWTNKKNLPIEAEQEKIFRWLDEQKGEQDG